MSRLPQNGIWNVKHGMDFFVDIVATKGLNFDKLGFIQATNNPMVLFTHADSTDFGIPQAFCADETLDYIITNRGYYSLDLSSSVPVFAELGNGGDGRPTARAGVDGIIYAGLLHASGSTDVRSYSGSSWTTRITSLSASYPHPLCNFENRVTLCVADRNVVNQTIVNSYSLDSANSLTIPLEYVITAMRWRGSELYIATRNISGGSAKLFIWNGTGTQARGYGIQGDWIYSLVDSGSSICIVTSTGQLLRFNGGGFDDLAYFPVYNTSYSWLSNASVASGAGKITNRGMITVGNLIYMNVDGEIHLNDVYPGTHLANQPSGLWCYDPEIGLYHASGLNYKKFAAKTVSSLASGNLVFATNHNAETGDACTVSTQSGLSGVTANQNYYVIKISSTTCKLALTPADALSGRALTITGTPSTDAIIFYPIDSYGVTQANAGTSALGMMNFNIPKAFYGLGLFIGGRIVDNAGASVECIQTIGLARGRGYFITSPIPSSGISDFFQKLFLGVHDISLSTDQITIKYRKLSQFGMPTALASIIWTSATTFTVDTLAYDFRGVSVGDEIEIVTGSGAGNLSHVTAINNASTTYTITLKDSIDGVVAADVGQVFADNWKLLGTINSTTSNIDNAFAEYPTDKLNSGVAQFKVEIRGNAMIRYFDTVQARNKQAQ